MSDEGGGVEGLEWGELEGERDGWVIRTKWRPRRKLPTQCWCKKRVVMVPQAELAKGFTRACRGLDCKEIDQDMRWKKGVAGDGYWGFKYED